MFSSNHKPARPSLPTGETEAMRSTYHANTRPTTSEKGVCVLAMLHLTARSALDTLSCLRAS